MNGQLLWETINSLTKEEVNFKEAFPIFTFIISLFRHKSDKTNIGENLKSRKKGNSLVLISATPVKLLILGIFPFSYLWAFKNKSLNTMYALYNFVSAFVEK